MARGRPDPSNYRRVPRTRTYRHQRTGRVVTDAEYRNIKARAAGYRNYYDYRSTARANRVQWDKMRAWLEDGGIPRRQLGAYSQLQRDGFDVIERRQRLPRNQLGDRMPDDLDPDLVAPDGPLARILIALGLRTESDWWAVGQSGAIKAAA